MDHINAHGTSTPLNDAVEASVIHDVFGTGPAVASTKGVLGHSLGATGAVEAALTVLSIEQDTIPPTANLDKRDPAIEIDIVVGAPRPRPIEVAMSNSSASAARTPCWSSPPHDRRPAEPPSPRVTLKERKPMAKHDLIAQRISGALYLVNGLSKLVAKAESPRLRLAAPAPDLDAQDDLDESPRSLPKRTTVLAVLFAAFVLLRVVSLLARRPGGQGEE